MAFLLAGSNTETEITTDPWRMLAATDFPGQDYTVLKVEVEVKGVTGGSIEIKDSNGNVLASDPGDFEVQFEITCKRGMKSEV